MNVLNHWCTRLQSILYTLRADFAEFHYAICECLTTKLITFLVGSFHLGQMCDVLFVTWWDYFVELVSVGQKQTKQKAKQNTVVKSWISFLKRLKNLVFQNYCHIFHRLTILWMTHPPRFFTDRLDGSWWHAC